MPLGEGVAEKATKRSKWNCLQERLRSDLPLERGEGFPRLNNLKEKHRINFGFELNCALKIMIWLVGCNGMLGSEIARQLKEKNLDFVGTDREVDFTDENAVFGFAEKASADGKKIGFIINCAAYTAVDKAESDKELAERVNVLGPKNLALLSKKIGATLIHISTDYVFDGNAKSPIAEDTPISPIGVYGVTKAEGEKAVYENTDRFYILRTAWLYGWAGKNFVYTMIRAMNTHDSVKVVSDQFGTPTFAGDLANMIVTIIGRNTAVSRASTAGSNNVVPSVQNVQKDTVIEPVEITTEQPIPYGIYHCTDLGEITWWDFTNEIKKQGIEAGFVTNKDCVVNPCTTEEYPTAAKRPAYSVLSKEKIQKTLGIKIPDWKESLRTFLASPLFDKGRIE